MTYMKILWLKKCLSVKRRISSLHYWNSFDVHLMLPLLHLTKNWYAHIHAIFSMNSWHKHDLMFMQWGKGTLCAISTQDTAKSGRDGMARRGQDRKTIGSPSVWYPTKMQISNKRANEKYRYNDQIWQNIHVCFLVVGQIFSAISFQSWYAMDQTLRSIWVAACDMYTMVHSVSWCPYAVAWW